MKKLVGCLVLVVMIGSIGLAAFAEDIELRMAWWGSQNRHDRTIKVIDMFMKEYPNIKISYEPSGWGDHWTKMATQAAGGNMPDIMQMDVSRLTEWAGREMLLPLDEFVESGVIDLSNVPAANLAGTKVDGIQYTMNLGINSQCMALDVDAFEKAGVDLPPQNWTWEDFENIAKEIHEKSGIWGMGNDLWNWQLAWRALYLGVGEQVYSADGKSLGYTDDQPLIDYMNLMLRLQEAGASPSHEYALGEFAGAGIEADPIVAGDAAMTYLWSNQVVAMWTAAGEDRNLKLVHLPRAKADGPAQNYIKPSMSFTIPVHSKHPKEAAMFIDFFTNSLEANKVLLAERGVPVSTVVADGLKESLTPPQVEMFDYLQRVKTDSNSLPLPEPLGHSQIFNDVYFPEVMTPVLLGKISPEEGAKILREQASEILAEAE